MNRIATLFSIFLILTGCGNKTLNKQESVINEIISNLDDGELNKAFILADSLKNKSIKGSELFMKTDSLAQIAERIAVDFSLDENEVISQLEKRSGSYSVDEKEKWDKSGLLEYRIINGRKMYFNRAVSNLMLLRKSVNPAVSGHIEDSSDYETSFRLRHTSEVMNESTGKTEPAVPVKMRITYTITVKPDVVPEGEIVRCWLPWPRNDQPRHDSITLLAASQPDYIIAPDSAIHSTIYMEKPAQKGVPAVFQITYAYRSKGQYFNPDEIKAFSYDKESEVFRKFTSEQRPQIHFSEQVRKMADSIAGDEKDPRIIVRKIYLWFKENIPWSGAMEYSIMPDIPTYVLKNRRGDCGMQTFLFMSMVRSRGIPVRWQSGWMVPPSAENLHDWCEVYYEGTGWVPADVSYDLQPSKKQKVKLFYLTGIDAYRMIVNTGVSGQLYPGKIFLRSEPYDFQRGEVEWTGGNLYFDKWDYDIKIDYLN